MNCQNHPDIPATAFCRSCGRPLCDACRRDAYGTVFCAEHAPAAQAAQSADAGPAAVPMPPAAGTAPSYAVSNVSPALAFFLGLIPGVGAIYNAQYAKGLVHAVIWGMLMSIANSRAAAGIEPVFVMLLIAWWFYMAMEAYHTARKRQAGEPVDEYSSIINLRGRSGQAPVAGIGLIVLGALLLLHTLDLLNFEYVARYWPVLLIAAGVYLLWGRFFAGKEMGHERQ